ncbi:MAG: DNA mismatch repair endonuclease MutL [Verrucomicrobiae bacterium]|nr:DNA mismatch repair endonuclease MutL [Verrucomicrobiae bacterium]
MNRIRLLPEHVANQIAAGEVVERPASVVKELVENALDAQATRIVVEIQAGGRSLIRVTDDGIGMSRDDALLSLERHATSKIQRAEDLAAIATMGFRGEALPSIASVSRFILTTREHPGPDGQPVEATQIVVHGGKIMEVHAAGAPPGTCVEVRQLFYNLPARRKFLRSEETEAAHIQHYLTLAALAHPAVAFTYLKEGRMVWQLPALSGVEPLRALRERLRALYGEVGQLLALDAQGVIAAGEMEEEAPPERPEVRLWGYIGAPGVSRATRAEQHLFVNRRPVENRGLNAALLEAYHTALMKGRYPVCCLFLEMDPAAVDVNIHPAKREVKFHREREVRGFVTRAVRQRLLDFHAAPAAARDTKESPGPQPAAPQARAEATPPAAQLNLAVPGQPALPIAATPLFNQAAAPAPARSAPPPPADASPREPVPRTVVSSSPASPAPEAGREPVPLLRVPLRLVGVIGRLYVVLESDRGLVLLDQHAAHERVLFEQMMARLERQEAVPSQRLLTPQTVELPPREAHFLKENLATLARLGVGLSHFGERTFLLDSLPAFMKTAAARQLVVDLVDELQAAGAAVNTLRLGEQVVAKTVCRHAVKAHDPLQGAELEELIEQLRRCAMPYTCPHGRPTLIEMSYRELEKKFGRIQ